MCLIAFAIGASPHWPLVIAANRDEFLSRPTLPLARWTTAAGQQVVSGRDLLAGGTWLGATPGGRIAFLTNVREGNSQPAPRSRGGLVTRWLEASIDAESFVATFNEEFGDYGGFNLVLGDLQRNAWTWVTNKADAATPEWQLHALKPGVYGVSNAALDTPWPKTVELKSVLHTALAAQSKAAEPDALQKVLWQALASRERASASRLPATGVSLALEEALSSAFVEFPENLYGTRNSTLVFARPGGQDMNPSHWEVRMVERTHLRDSSTDAQLAYSESDLAFNLA